MIDNIFFWVAGLVLVLVAVFLISTLIIGVFTMCSMAIKSCYDWFYDEFDCVKALVDYFRKNKKNKGDVKNGRY